MTSSPKKLHGNERAPGEPAHSELGPSSAKRWINCPGSVLATRGMTTDGRAAREGTAAHTLADWVRTQKKSAWDFVGKVIKVPWEGDPTKIDEFTVDGEMAEAVNGFVEYCDDFGADIAFSELRVRYDAWVPGGFGTSDFVGIRLRDKTCKVVDLKFGKGVPVYAKGNEQLRLYALGIFHGFNWLYDIESWELGIYQPRLGIVETDEISTTDLIAWANTVAAPAAKRALTPGAPFKAGDWCQFCALRQTCRTRADVLKATVLDEFEDVSNGEAETRTEVKTIATLSPDEMFQIHLQAPAIRKLLDDIEEFGFNELSNGRPFGDRKLVAGRSFRRYIDEKKAEAALIDLLGDDAWQPASIISPAQAEKKLGKKHEFMANHVEKPEGKPTMVGPEDKREPLNMARAAEFDDVSEGATEDFLV